MLTDCTFLLPRRKLLTHLTLPDHHIPKMCAFLLAGRREQLQSRRLLQQVLHILLPSIIVRLVHQANDGSIVVNNTHRSNITCSGALTVPFNPRLLKPTISSVSCHSVLRQTHTFGQHSLIIRIGKRVFQVRMAFPTHTVTFTTPTL